MNQGNLFILNDVEWDMVIEGVEQLKSKHLVGDLVGKLLESVISKKEADMTPEELAEKRACEARKRMEEEMKKKEEETYKRKVELLKAKLVLMREQTIQGQDTTNQ